MLTITSEAFTYWLNQGFYPFIRLLALFTTAPFFNEKQAITKTRIILALFTIVIISPLLPAVEIPLFSMMGIRVVLIQIGIGLIIGLTMQIIFAAVRYAGEIIGLQMGLSFATFFDASSGPNVPILGRILNLFMMLLFLLYNGHLWLIDAVINSFESIPIQQTLLNRDGFWSLVQFADSLFINGLMLALPFITLFLILNITLGILNRMTPQLSTFAIGFPLTLTIGISMLGLLISILPHFTGRLLHQAFEQLSLILSLFV
ncbi:flagellar biosynthetic protein FliR [Providencia sneebia]|uniref:Flagellar biosynthetic protein FliR n=1 Tax=Providencia sneebia DSM 19967 TaxID=1141660 RepID=K8WM65_9GAMM|nr:flagellar biosynthetic protein FliR [Providencia sneebia]EKT58567.1 flagellar biosynthetic protein [Providencia sneebia DSM 19967]